MIHLGLVVPHTMNFVALLKGCGLGIESVTDHRLSKVTHGGVAKPRCRGEDSGGEREVSTKRTWVG